MTIGGSGEGQLGGRNDPDTDTGRMAFLATYDRVMRRWPGSETIDLESRYGGTRIWACGPEEAPPVVLIHAYQATSAEWIDLAAGLSGQRRVYALDVIGDAGHSTVGRTAIETPADMAVWLDTVLEGLGLNSAEICGHSYGAWIALDYALGHPTRIDRVTLLDPTMCFGPLLPLYVIRALPSLLKGTAARRRSLIRWESRRAALDPDWLSVTAAAADEFGQAPTVRTKIPPASAYAGFDRPSLVIMAGRSRVHSARVVARRAQGRLPQARVDIVAGASHYGLPMTHADEIAELMLRDRLD
jgi:pimeloyl-ACP methyl ester carboxylesterase